TAPPGPQGVVGGRRRRAITRTQGPDCRQGGDRRTRESPRPGAEDDRARDKAADPPGRWPCVAQSVVTASGPAGSDRYTSHSAGGAARDTRGSATSDRSHGADAALFSSRRPPTGAVQRFARRG